MIFFDFYVAWGDILEGYMVGVYCKAKNLVRPARKICRRIRILALKMIGLVLDSGL